MNNTRLFNHMLSTTISFVKLPGNLRLCALALELCRSYIIKLRGGKAAITNCSLSAISETLSRGGWPSAPSAPSALFISVDFKSSVSECDYSRASRVHFICGCVKSVRAKALAITGWPVNYSRGRESVNLECHRVTRIDACAFAAVR